MLIYYLALSLSLAFAYFGSKKEAVHSGQSFKTIKRSRNLAKTIWMLMPLALVMLFRWNVGVDSFYGNSYSSAYHAAAEGINFRKFEPGYFFMSAMISKMHIPFFWFLFLLSIIYLICVCYGITRASVSPAYSILIFVLSMAFFDAFSALRQSLAQGLCIVALSIWISKDESNKKSITSRWILGCIAIACFFHYIAIIYIPIYLICNRKYRRNRLVLISICAIVASPIIHALLNWAIRLTIGSRYQTEGFASSYAALAVIIFALCIWKYNDMLLINPNAYILINLSLCVAVLMINSSALVLPYRFFDGIKICYIFTIPLIIKSERKVLFRIGITLIVLIVFGLFFWNSLYNQDSVYAHYQSVLNNWSYISTLY